MDKAVLEKIKGIVPVESLCGNLYELDYSPLKSSAVAEILGATTPHYHPEGGKYFAEKHEVVSGAGILVVGSKIFRIYPGSIVEIPPMKVHYTIPDGVMWVSVANTPGWTEANTIPLEGDNKDVEYSTEFEKKLLFGIYQERLNLEIKNGLGNFSMEELRDRLTVH